MKTTFVQSYLFFGGRCEEALDFYRRAAGAEVKLLMHFNESPRDQFSARQAGSDGTRR